MGQWEQAREVLLSAAQERGGGRGGHIEIALDSVLVSVTEQTGHQTDFSNKFTKSTGPALLMLSMFVVCIFTIATGIKII